MAVPTEQALTVRFRMTDRSVTFDFVRGRVGFFMSTRAANLTAMGIFKGEDEKKYLGEAQALSSRNLKHKVSSRLANSCLGDGG